MAANVPAADHDDMKDFEDHSCLKLVEFVSETAVQEAHEILKELYLNFGTKQPVLSKYRAAFQWVQDEYSVLPVTAKKKEIQGWVEIQAAALRSRAMYGIRLWSKEVQLLKDILTLLATDGDGGEDGGSDASSDSGAEDSAGEESSVADEPAAEGSDMDTCDTQVPMQSSADESSTKSKVLPPVPKFSGGAKDPSFVDSEPSASEIPLKSQTPDSSLAPSHDEIPAKSETPDPLKSVAPDSSLAPSPDEMPAKSEAADLTIRPSTEIPMKSEAPDLTIRPSTEIPMKSEAPDSSMGPKPEIPVKSQALDCPMKSQAPAAAVPPHVPDMQCPDSANAESPKPMSGTNENPVKEETTRAAEKAASEPLIQERPEWNVEAKVAELKAKGYIIDAKGEQESLDEYAGLPEVQSKLTADNPTPEPGPAEKKDDDAAVPKGRGKKKRASADNEMAMETAAAKKPKKGNGKKGARAEEQEAREETSEQEDREEIADTKKPKKGKGKGKDQQTPSEAPASSSTAAKSKAKAKPKTKATKQEPADDHEESKAKKEEPTGEDEVLHISGPHNVMPETAALAMQNMIDICATAAKRLEDGMDFAAVKTKFERAKHGLY
ncbi:unnamed protein product [Symbiodinium sp. CCMP2592]|nr:unnamed protein product [Symbiodinium sp. CCMP2592]